MDTKSKMFRSLGKAYYKFITNLLQQENWKIQDDQQEEAEQESSKLKTDKNYDKQIFQPIEENLETIVKRRQDEIMTPIQKKKTLNSIISIESSENEDIFNCKDCNINFSNKTDLIRHNQAHNIQFELDEEYE